KPLINDSLKLLEELECDKWKTELKNLQTDTLEPTFWHKADAQEIMQEISLLQEQIEQYEKIQSLVDDLKSFEELISSNENEIELDLESEIARSAATLKKLTKDFSVKQYLSGKYDKNSAILSVHSGQGGTEAMDWAEMLQRMYLHYFEKKNWKFDLLSEVRGEEAGIKEASFEIKTPYAYGYLKQERGTHRLVRLSPFNADNLRQTSFALVEVMPVIGSKDSINLNEEDLSWKFTRAGGPGGQAVNKTSSAVELTHIPSSITVKNRSSRSQSQNKENALKILKAKLAMIAEENLQKKIDQEKGKHQHASWGTQIRNYVLHPYQLVKDTRTEVETSDAQGVLDGDLDRFIEAEIKL
ncbi:MAG: Uncharacterized protein XD95_0689, partial [Microgenomates bacterium 39_7]